MPSYTLINEKMLEVSLEDSECFAKQGAMVAYTGSVRFSRSFLGNEGVQSMAMRAVTNEGLRLMKAAGRGKVCYAYHGQFVTIVPVRGETFYVESDSLLAFDPRMRTGTMFLGNQGLQAMVRGAATGAGLFTTTLSGQGEVAILSDGNAIALAVTPDRPLCVDPNAYLGHVGELTSSFQTDLNWKTLIGQASGESYQIKFTGRGMVYVQASER